MTVGGGRIGRTIIGIAAVVLLGSAVARAAEHPLEVEGRTHFAKGEYQRALDIYAKLFAETNEPLFLRNIGRCYQKLQDPGRAVDAFREYLRRSPNLEPSEQAEVQGFIREMEDLKRTQEKTALAPPPPAAPDLRAREPGPAAPTGGVLAETVTGPQSAPVEGKPWYKKPWFWIVTGAVVAAGVTTALLVAGSGSSSPVLCSRDQCAFPPTVVK